MISPEHFMWLDIKHEHLHKNFINYFVVKQNHNEIYSHTNTYERRTTTVE